MSGINHAAPTTAFLICLGALIGVLVGCASDSGPAEPPPSYTVRGVLRSLPEAGADPAEVLIRHEEIPEFADQDGKVVGMGAMSMPFALDDPALLDGFAQGDGLEIDFEVRFDQRKLLWLTDARAAPVD